jgi:ElaB/YqjD/DUF883 family membrane-anchored ribosome-binding protein
MAVTRKPDKDEGEAEAAVADPLRAEIAALRADLAELGTAISRVGRRRAQGLKAAAETAAQDGYAKGEAVLDEALAELRSFEDEIADAARRRPFAALGLAAVVGFLIGVLFRR